MRNASGFIFVDGQEVAETLKCVHCQYTWRVKHGSGIQRGWCMNCNGPHCGGQNCWECVPFKKKLDEYEAGKRKTLP
jgi:hypothetical protein